jgi:superfamily II DNA or RNA helicase
VPELISPTKSNSLIVQRLAVEELLRLRRSDSAERFAETFRHSTVDPNPHQIEAAAFALQRLSSGGALLCDEVGLGKTIEAGLVISQFRAESRNHILIIVPLALARQWQVELQDLFGISATIIGGEDSWHSSARGVHIIGREAASANKLRSHLRDKGLWDLIVVDEAHEMFATIHTRFNKRNGKYLKDLSKGTARRAASIKELMEGSPVLLLTATPIQNNLLELWALVQYVDPDQQILGTFNEFNSIFVSGEGGRGIVPGTEEMLRSRLSLVLKRTLRKQAQPFMKTPFRSRQVHTANFNPGAMEISLYSAVTAWLNQERLAAYKKTHRRLLALQLRRRMASSPEALLSTLEKIRERMELIKTTGRYPVSESTDEEFEFADDSDREDEAEVEVDFDALNQDLQTITKLHELASNVVSQNSDFKKKKLLEVINQVATYAKEGVSSDKLVIFTESKKTLESLFSYLENNGFKDQVTTFSGANEGYVGERALKLWEAEVGAHMSSKPDPAAMIRGALIHEFKNVTKILIATEAGAKGLNLQFCNCLVNYDLPWNPQRIEQRIGRVHRYGQRYDVIIINFLNLSNEAEQRVYQLLEEKLSVFNDVLDSSDSILTLPEAALNLEFHINDMLARCRTPEQIQDAFDKLNLEIDAQQRQLKDVRLENARSLIAELDSNVQKRLGIISENLGTALSKRDETLLRLLNTESPVKIEFTTDSLTVFNWKDKRFHIGPPGPSDELGESMNSQHPWVKAIIDSCIDATQGQTLTVPSDSNASWEVFKIRVHGLEDEEHIAIVGGEFLDVESRTWNSLEHAIDFYKNEALVHQSNRVTLMLQQIRARRADLDNYEESELSSLQKKLNAATRARVVADTPAKKLKAQTQQTKIENEIAKFKSENFQQKELSLNQLNVEERRLHLGQSVSATQELLFRVTGLSSRGENK